jgi:AcrR family transcriptional regulator
VLTKLKINLKLKMNLILWGPNMRATRKNTTKRQLIQAAREVFAAQGPDAKILDICDLAEANMAAVSYHFGGKDGLYLAVLDDFMQEMTARYPLDEGVTADSPPEECLRAYVRSLLLQTMGDGDPVSKGLARLFTREFIEPSQHFAALYDRYCRPYYDGLLGIVRRLLPTASENDISRAASCIIGQCTVFDWQEAYSRVLPEMELKVDNIEPFTDFILEFSLGGLDRLRAKRTRPQPACASRSAGRP